MSNLIILLVPLLLLFMMFRSNKKRQDQAKEMRSALEPGAGVRTIGGMYALVKSVNEETVELEVAPGTVVHFTKGAIAAVLEREEYDAIINGRPIEDEPTESVDEADEKPLSLDKKDESDIDGTDDEAPKSK
ncbi:preprotein translocase subunit YajC [Kitasatospora gansuensis]|uniref:Preprotein translocase subunit YajC n=1 Tax=Kitasatospora gansuensis TaxID=258050 RepID=A0A7W7S9H0_9ACTN|nr:preprotein translocase subunit YajC [Kitasatospora gansuensis]MBB4945341.1 preprotein translocase subunit YajC [Kitasatospora gansuensis]